MAGEWRQIAGNRPAFAAMIVAIAVYAVYYPQPYLEEALRDIPVAVVDLDQSSTSRLLIRRMDATDTVAIAVRVPDMAAAREAFFSRKVYGVAVIPAGFERKLLRGGASPVALFGDASYFLMYRQVTTGVVTTALSVGANVEFLRLITGGTDPSLAQAAVDPLPLNSVALFNPQGGYATNVLPAALVLILQQTLLMGIGLLATSRERLPLTARCDAPLRALGKPARPDHFIPVPAAAGGAAGASRPGHASLHAVRFFLAGTGDPPLPQHPLQLHPQFGGNRRPGAHQPDGCHPRRRRSPLGYPVGADGSLRRPGAGSRGALQSALRSQTGAGVSRSGWCKWHADPCIVGSI
jgi:hypothetical protein